MDTTNSKRVLLIDADCWKYIFGHRHRDLDNVQNLSRDIRIRLKELLNLAGTKYYLGFFGSDCAWRIKQYKYKLYKGNRGEKPDFVQKWGPTIEQYCMETLGFLKIPNWEADDAIAYLAAYSSDFGTSDYQFVTCSPDKDLNQIPGWHLHYNRDIIGQVDGNMTFISIDQATKTFWLQMLTGDSTDNVAGVPGLGEKKAEALLKDKDDGLEMELAVAEAYRKYFEGYYGPKIFQQTYDALRMGPPPMIPDIEALQPLAKIQEIDIDDEIQEMYDMLNF